MKLIIQIPCYNEEETLAATLRALPGKVEGISCIEYLVIDDGSGDKTASIARENNVDHIVHLPYRSGLARAYMAGLQEALRRGADIIVNTDADNQYNADDIQRIVRPLVEGTADICIGERAIRDVSGYTSLKRVLHRLGNIVLRKMTIPDVQDAPSGFRGMSADAARQCNIFTDFTYTIEMLFWAKQKRLRVMTMPVRVNAVKRPSRLMKNLTDYVFKSITTVFRVIALYRPFAFFLKWGLSFLTMGVITSACAFCSAGKMGDGKSYIWLIVTALLWWGGLQLVILAFVADMHAAKRKILEEIQYSVRSNKGEMNAS